jgi:glycosyltransferase involved in cell wall biosynthesis
MPELVKPGITGEIYASSSESALSGAMQRLVENSDGHAKMRNACLAESAKFSVEKICREYLEVYEGTLRRSGGKHVGARYVPAA